MKVSTKLAIAGAFGACAVISGYAITQEADAVFRPGERVRLLSGGGVTRVRH